MEGHCYQKSDENLLVNIITKPQEGGAAVDHLHLPPPAHFQHLNQMFPSSMINKSFQSNSTASSHHRWSQSITSPGYINRSSCIDVEKFPVDCCSCSIASEIHMHAVSKEEKRNSVTEVFPITMRKDPHSQTLNSPSCMQLQISSSVILQNRESTTHRFFEFPSLSLRGLQTDGHCTVGRSQLQDVQCDHFSSNRANDFYYAPTTAMWDGWMSKWVSNSQRKDNVINMRRISPEPPTIEGDMISTRSPADFVGKKQNFPIGSNSLMSMPAAPASTAWHCEDSQTKSCGIFIGSTHHEPQHVDSIVELSIEPLNEDSSDGQSPRGSPHIHDHCVHVENDDAYAPFRTKYKHMNIPSIYGDSNNNSVAGDDAASKKQPDAEDYFETLEGPELEVLRPGRGQRTGAGAVVRLDLPCSDEEPLWPFLLRFPIGCFGICLGLGSQAIMWRTLTVASSMRFLHVPGAINLALWFLSLVALIAVSTIYSLKCIFYAKAVRREFCHPVRVNFFFAPWLAIMFLALSLPPSIFTASHLHPSLAFLLMVPVFALQLKIYGQWLSGGEKRLSRVANPSTHLSLVGNFVGSFLAASCGVTELAIFFWAVGIAHYLVLFVTLYQRLPSATSLPKELHPAFFLFVAVPSCASIAWSQIMGEFDLVAKIAYFVSLFLLASLVVRVNLFRGLRFSIAWWAYTTPMTAAAIATIYYSVKVTHPLTQGMALMLSFISSMIVVSILVITMLHAFFWRTLFPNDVAIAISVNAKDETMAKNGNDRE